MIPAQPDPLVGIGMTLAVVLAAVFAVAGVVKLGSPSKTATELAGLGVPAPRLVARTLPLAELAIAGLLLAAPSWGGMVATGCARGVHQVRAAGRPVGFDRVVWLPRRAERGTGQLVHDLCATVRC